MIQLKKDAKKLNYILLSKEIIDFNSELKDILMKFVGEIRLHLEDFKWKLIRQIGFGAAVNLAENKKILFFNHLWSRIMS